MLQLTPLIGITFLIMLVRESVKKSYCGVPLKILHVSTEDIAGGAGRATFRLHTGLRRLGYDSSMYVIHRGSKHKDSMVTVFNASMDWTSRIRRRLRRRRIDRDFARYGASRPAGFEVF